MNPKRFSSEKSHWKRKVDQACREVDGLAYAHRQGRHLGMGVLYECAHKIQKLGVSGDELRKTLDKTKPAMRQRKRVHQSIAAICKLVEIASQIIENILDVQETPKAWFPGYVCDMHSSATIETAPLENFEALRRRIEGGDDEKGL